jgi:Fe-S oxidoreductase
MRLSAFADALRQNAIVHDQDLFASPEVIALGKQTYAPSRRALLLELVRIGAIGWTPDLVDAIYAGLNSGVQHAFSVYRGDPAGWPDETHYVRAARADIVDAGLAPPYVRAIADAFHATGSPFGDAGQGTQHTDGSVVLFIDASTRALAPETAEAARKLVNRADPDAGELSGGTSGYELFDLGLWDDAATAIRTTVHTLEQLGAEAVVSESPEAVVALTGFASSLGITHGISVQHLSAWLATHLREPFAVSMPRRATYHDSSRLGRGLGVFDAPRALLGDIPDLELVEMRYRCQEAIPTGPTLGYPYPEAIPGMALRRLTEAMDTSADLVVVSSPYSKRNLRLAPVNKPPEIRDLLDVLAAGMGNGGK